MKKIKNKKRSNSLAKQPCEQKHFPIYLNLVISQFLEKQSGNCYCIKCKISSLMGKDFGI